MWKVWKEMFMKENVLEASIFVQASNEKLWESEKCFSFYVSYQPLLKEGIPAIMSEYVIATSSN